ncbi:L-threonylcarbamoyladenylate synthase [Paenibacillus paeoniae]|uniref:Threonylcarbamoyl-AMP synthase n=1 Tax=Paenibacillus paeoniae TaxID=2292705 RepID=A0A371P0R7_9BACL|nr:L-threonylcarbamoyladenylate synthase [Paenibacillus paeoniae]REK69495.1 threonylcarbamoyl-AMP synthase [Paenibacillus paeoniae]
MALNTKVWIIQDKKAEESGWTPTSEIALREAADRLRLGGLVAFPTETVYGLGANACSTEAVAGIYQAKGRPSDNPLIVHVASEADLDELVFPYPSLAGRLMERFWPGPLTIVLPVRPGVLSPLVTANLSTVGIRMPDHPAALELIQLAGCPVAAPSANRSGRPSPTVADHVLEDLNGRIDGIVDGGATGVGLESTVVELEGECAIRILRPGGVTAEALRLAFPDAEILYESEESSMSEQPRSPGMKYTHYAPKGELAVVQGQPDAVVAYVNEQARQYKENGVATGVLSFSERVCRYEADLVLDLGGQSRLEEAAQRLYGALRQFDEAGVSRIWAEACVPEGIGGALMNRLVKAAGGRIIDLDK